MPVLCVRWWIRNDARQSLAGLRGTHVRACVHARRQHWRHRTPSLDSTSHPCACPPSLLAGHADCVHALLGADGVDANQAPAQGSTALFRAAQFGRADCVRALLGVPGVDTNRGTHYCASPLHAAATARQHGWQACVRALASASGTRVNRRDGRTGRTALHLVCAHKEAGLASRLLAAGACRFALDLKGSAPLGAACGDAAVRKAFASGPDYWQRKLHGLHSCALKDVARVLLLVRQRLAAPAAPALPALHPALHPAPGPGVAGTLAPHPAPLPHLPEEIWLAALAFLRSADFVPP